MKVVQRFKLTLSDGEKSLSFEGTAEWLPGGDDQVLFVTRPVAPDEGAVLDEWESNKTELSVALEPIVCIEDKGPSFGFVAADCGDLADYASQEGKAVLTWVYGNKETKIYLTFTEVG